MTGASIAGPLIGSGGAGTRVTLTFTPTAAPLTLTVTGAPENVQLEVGSFASTPIVTAGTSVARAADNLTFAMATILPGATGYTVYGKCILSQQSPANQIITSEDDGSTNNRYALYSAISSANITLDRRTAAAGSTVTAGTFSAGVQFGFSRSVDLATGVVDASISAAAAVQRTGGPTSGLTTMRLGQGSGTTTALFGLIGPVSLVARTTPAAALPALSGN